MTKPRPEQPAPSREYAEFEELARKLVRVPKREIDEKRAKSNGKKPKTT